MYSYWHSRFSNKIQQQIDEYAVPPSSSFMGLREPNDRAALLWQEQPFLEHEAQATVVKVKLIGLWFMTLPVSRTRYWAQTQQTAGQARWNACVPLVTRKHSVREGGHSRTTGWAGSSEPCPLGSKPDNSSGPMFGTTLVWARASSMNNVLNSACNLNWGWSTGEKAPKTVLARGAPKVGSEPQVMLVC